MSTRWIVTFTRSFHLSGFDGQQPAGRYSVEFDDSLMDGMTYAPYRQMATMVRVGEESGNAGEMAVIDPKELQDVLAADAVADFPPGYGEVSQPATDRVLIRSAGTQPGAHSEHQLMYVRRGQRVRASAAARIDPTGRLANPVTVEIKRTE